MCQQMGTNTHPTAMLLMLIKSHTHWPFQQVTMNFITDLPISNGFNSIFIMVNQGLSKGVILCPCNKTINAERTIKLYINNVFIQFRLPDMIISDRGPQFTYPISWESSHLNEKDPSRNQLLHGNNETRPPPDLVEGNEEYKIEAILSHCLHKNQETTYLIKWKGYDSSENSWEPESSLTNAEEELNTYKKHWNIQWRQ